MKRPTLRQVKRMEGATILRVYDSRSHWVESAIWCYLEANVPPHLLFRVLMLKRRRRRGASFVDLAIKSASLDSLLPLLRKLFERVCMAPTWSSRAPPLGANPNLAGRVPKREPCDPPLLVTFASLNVNGLRAKREAVEHLAVEDAWSVFGLQETLVKSRRPPLLGPFEMVVSPRSRRPGERGLALGIRKGLRYVVYTLDPNFVIISVSLSGPAGTTWFFANVYVPCARVAASARLAMLIRLGSACRLLLDRHPHRPFLLMGDFNCQPAGMPELVLQISPSLRWFCPLGNSHSYRSRLRPPDESSVPVVYHSLDHCVVNGAASELLLAPTVDQTVDIADHYPIITRIAELVPAAPMVLTPPRIRFDRKGLQSLDPVLILRDQRWKALLRKGGVTTEMVFNTMYQIARSAKLFKPVVPSTMRTQDGLLCRLFRRRRSLFAQYNGLRMGARRNLLVAQYQCVLARCSRRVKELRRASFLVRMAAGVSLIQEKDIAGFWRWVRTISGQGRDLSSTMVSPVLRQDGVLEVETDAIIATWKHYLENLYSYHPPSNPESLWRRREAATPQQRRLGDINGDITLRELDQCLCRMSGGKSPGPDGFPTEWFKTIRSDPCFGSMTTPAPSPTFFTQAILKAINVIFKDGVPPKHNVAWICSIPKGTQGIRDPLDTRGIALIEVILKILANILSERLSCKLEESGFFVPSQSGFRKKHEAMASVIALRECILRRTEQSLETYVAFLDLRKAYDWVPHEGLFFKLTRAGIHGRCFRFIQSLYESAVVAGIVGPHLTPNISVKRGVRQGCPLSPLLFNIFINDFIHEGGDFGIGVPGLELQQLLALLFADDIARMADSAENIQSALDLATEWAELWEMKFSVAKSGVMVFNQQEENRCSFSLGGEALLRVQSYVYLGIRFEEDLGSEGMLATLLKERAATGKQTLWRFAGTLRNYGLPVWIRIHVLKTLVIPTMTYGCELFAFMSHRRLDALEAVIVKGLKWVVGKSADSKQVTGAALMREFNVPPVYAFAARQVVRLVEKFRELESWLSLLIASDVPKRKRASPYFFLYRYDRWLNRRSHRQIRDLLEPGMKFRDAVLIFTWNEWDRVNGGVSLPAYMGKGFQSTRDWYLSALSLGGPSNAGVRFLCQARLGCIAFSPMARGRMPVVMDCCPLCHAPWDFRNLDEQLEHLVFVCPSLLDIRRRFLSPVLAQLVGRGCFYQGDRIRLALGGTSRQGARLNGWGRCRSPSPGEANQIGTARGPNQLRLASSSNLMASFLGFAVPRVCRAVQNG